ncbi:hypothetical protein C5167_026042 [Papaver somniferum]|nr:hypothetical protein C5167_026042 [Papaver somniferum]
MAAGEAVVVSASRAVGGGRGGGGGGGVTATTRRWNHLHNPTSNITSTFSRNPIPISNPVSIGGRSK